MANYVKISALGPDRREMDPNMDLDLCVKDMIDYWDRQLSNVLPDKPDLIVLPEACDRPANYDREQHKEYYAVRGDRVRDHFMQVARENHCNIAYSAARTLPDGTMRNSTQFINRKGGVDGIYDKNYLMVTEHTEGKLEYGRDASIVKTDFGTVGGLICFDLNFDELRLRYQKTPPDLLVFSSMYHGGMMQNVWAYSCRSYLVSAIAGPPCQIISPQGVAVAASTNYTKYVTATVNLDYKLAHMDFNMDKVRALKQKYGAKVKITDPGYLGSILITSETDECSAADMVVEFGIELLDDYFARSTKAREDSLGEK
ncbi:MAG TPA: carbon-nitrogen hydrolase family protein [Oscillospiraceae bacterium]|nr:carbon-nitrogen hydrolase family protein [Oscillospiraceae bacterium]HPF56947.1 carbon-nitrogen hydrolase family protein [Clostridiales bacterium]HPK35251.1 carbon-nitrogen hydrolase family protein [Oscillospiraceae bacterium]HPR75444.1 carbon-nitrogen hydrolase family protein [Oscillospiraceae bacterium]